MALASLTYYPLYAWLGQVTNPGAVNYPVAIFIIFILVSYVGMVYGPVGAFLAEYFPSRIATRPFPCPTTSATAGAGVWCLSSPPRHFSSTGSVGYALIYPIVVPAVCFIICLFIMPETRHISIWEPGRPRLFARNVVPAGRGRPGPARRRRSRNLRVVGRRDPPAHVSLSSALHPSARPSLYEIAPCTAPRRSRRWAP